MKDEIKILINSKDIFELLHNIKLFLDKEYDKDSIAFYKRNINRVYKNYVYNYIKNKEKYKNIIIYPSNKPILIVGYFLQIESDLKEVLKFVLKKYKDEFYKKRTSHIEEKEQYDMIDLADKKLNYLKVVNNSSKTLHIFHFNQLSKKSSCNIHFIEKKGKYSYYFEVYDCMESPYALNKYAIFTFGLGRFLNWILMKDPYEAPYGFDRLLKKEKMYLLVDNKIDLPTVFSDVFSSVVLDGSIYADKKLEKLPKTFKNYLEEQIELYLKNIYEHKETKEISGDEICLCGSNKKYKDCCQKKEIKWVKEENKIYKEIIVEPEIINILKKFEKRKEELLNRNLYNEEKIFSELTVLDLSFNKLIKKLRKAGLPEDLLYATYKTNRVITEFNIDKVPDIELKEWNKAIKEYNSIINKNNEKHISSITLIKIINNELDNLWQINNEKCIQIINSYIGFFEKKYDNYKKFSINNINDFLVFCARKLSINLQSLNGAIEHDDNDTAMAINRNLFEILINVIAYTNNPSLFKEKILPISKVNNGTYEYLRNKEGYVSKNKIVNIKTKEVINIQITTAELSKKAGNLYKDLYDNLFNELSFYVHLNVNSISKFFDEPDPFYEIDPIAISSLLGMFFVVESIYYIAKSSEIDNLLYRDMIYISDDIKSQMKPIIEVILEIENYKNPVYRILDKIISNYELIK